MRRPLAMLLICCLYLLTVNTASTNRNKNTKKSFSSLHLARPRGEIYFRLRIIFIISLHSVKHLLGKKFARFPSPDSWPKKRFSSLHLQRIAAVMPPENGKIWRPKDFYIPTKESLNSCLMTTCYLDMFRVQLMTWFSLKVTLFWICWWKDWSSNQNDERLPLVIMYNIVSVLIVDL